MRKYILVIVALVMVCNIQAQVDDTNQEKGDLLNKKVKMDVDMQLYKSIGVNVYESENPKSKIHAQFIPESYESLKKSLESGVTRNLSVIEKGEQEIKGAKILFVNGTVEKDGITYNTQMYGKEIDTGICLMFGGIIDASADPKYHKAFEKAVTSIMEKN